MNTQKLERMKKGKGFIAALDQSGGSTPKALKLYGIQEDVYSNEDEMFDLVHEMRTRIITSPSFTSQHILGAILFEMTMERKIKGKLTADYLWEEKGILPFLKIDKGLMDERNGVQLMKPIPHLDALLQRALDHHIFGTKMRSVIKQANTAGIHNVVIQQFDLGVTIAKTGLVPILEPEIDIHIPDKKEAETLLKKELLQQLQILDKDVKLMFKLTIPEENGFYGDLMKDTHVIRVVALSGGYTQMEANEKLSKNPGLIASFSRALSQGLSYQQSQQEFNQMLETSINAIYHASIQ